MEFKIALINMLSPLVREAYNMHDQVGYFGRETNITKSNENSINENHSNKDKECLQ